MQGINCGVSVKLLTWCLPGKSYTKHTQSGCWVPRLRLKLEINRLKTRNISDLANLFIVTQYM
jgi:hypothetical protein